MPVLRASRRRCRCSVKGGALCAVRFALQPIDARVTPPSPHLPASTAVCGHTSDRQRRAHSLLVHSSIAYAALRLLPTNRTDAEWCRSTVCKRVGVGDAWGGMPVNQRLTASRVHKLIRNTLHREHSKVKFFPAERLKFYLMYSTLNRKNLTV